MRRAYTIKSVVIGLIIINVVIFLLTEAAPGNVARGVLGHLVTPEQEASFLAQMGLDKPAYLRTSTG